MNPHNTISIILAVILLTLSSCGKSENQKESGEMDHGQHEEMAMGTGEPSEMSIYNVSSRWTDQNGGELDLADLRGKNRVVAMVYTHCEYACPRIVADLRRIRDGLEEDVLDETGFVIVSIDPERDTPGRLHTFASENNLDDEHWTLLNGSQGDILELAALLGVKYKRINETDFSHSNLITVLNKDGEIVHRHRSIGANLQDVVNVLSGL